MVLSPSPRRCLWVSTCSTAMASMKHCGMPHGSRPPGTARWKSARSLGRGAIDRLRRDRTMANRAAHLAELIRLDELELPATSEASMIADDRLRLIFTCCHPALDPSAQIALTLRTVGGLTTGEIAHAFV